MKPAEIKRVLLDALTGAGRLMRESIDKPQQIEQKAELSIVTQTDLACERIVMDTIRKSFPDHAFLAEESDASGDSACRWIIDPIDGTTNFAHGFPVASVSIAYEEEGTLQAGGIYDPFRDELFLAQKGLGATMNGKPIQVSQTPDIDTALLGTGFPYDRRERADEYLAIMKSFLMKAQGLRRGGSAALDLCYVACGRFDGYWEAFLNPWDKAAGMILIEEAGGRISDFSGGPMLVDGCQNLASNGLIHDAMLEVLTPHQGVGL